MGPANARAIEQMAHTSKSKDWNGPGRAWDRHYDPIREAKKRRKMQKEKERDQALREFDANSQHARGLSSSSHQSAFDLKKELPALQQTLAQSHLEATSLLNALQHYHSQPRHGSDLAEASASPKSHSPGFRKPSVSHGGHTSITPGSISADPALASKFNSCKALRRQVLRYIENISDEQWLGGLISANEALVGALKSFEILDGAADGDGSDSDSDVEQAEGVQHQRPRGENEEDVEEEDDEEEEVAREDEDEDDPFADRNAIK